MKHAQDIFRMVAALALFLAAACTKDPSFADPTGGSGHVLVPVSLNLAVAPDEPGTPGTKTDYEPDGAPLDPASEIKTVQILQFVEDAAGVQRWTGIPLFFDHWPLASGENVTLVATSRPCTVFVIANTWGPIPLTTGVSLDDFLTGENCDLIDGLDNLTGSGIWYSPNPTDATPDRYLRMSGVRKIDSVSMDTVIGSDGDRLTLKRNCAKVVVRVKDSAADVAVEAVQLCGINRKYYYVTNREGFSDPYSVSNPHRFDDVERAYPDGGVAGTGADAGYTVYTYYVPANLRGEDNTVTTQSEKSEHAPHGATCFRIYGKYGSSPEKDVTYTYYLGANLTTDFNLEPNKKYTYTIDITRKGSASHDGRIEDLDDVTFQIDANSYMLVPPTRSGQVRTYKIPVRRAAVFWNDPSRPNTPESWKHLGVYGAGNDAKTYVLTEDCEWTVQALWNSVVDKNGTTVPSVTMLTVSSGKGFDPAEPGSQPYISVQVGEGMSGNLLVVLRKKAVEGTGDDPKYFASDDILWSWHLWVTDYNPYVEWTPIADTYIYNVPGGDIHRYGGDIWTAGGSTDEYVDGFIMDRNLGATAAGGSSSILEDASRGLYYQFGRKDPFRSGNYSTIKANATGQEPEGAALKYNIKYSVWHPNVFFDYNGNWTAYESPDDPDNNVLGSISAIWNDHKAAEHQESYNEAGKSFYDPCPPGWRLPLRGTWANFSTAYWTASYPTRNTKYNAAGLFYDPAGDGSAIYYPNAGIIRPAVWGSSNVAFFRVGTNGYAWSASPSGVNAGELNFDSASVSPSGATIRTVACPVRCVRVAFVKPY